MTSLALKYPSLTMLLTFLIVSLGGSLLGFIWGLSIMWNDPCDPNSGSPCDGAAMAAGMIWVLSIVASILAGAIISVSVFVFLQRKVKSTERML
jgi:hypothetical protein